MFVVAGVTGHTGKVVAETLLAQSLPVRVIVRDAKKGEAFKAKGAEVFVGDVRNVKDLTAALKGASGAYLLNPPDMSVTELEKWGKETGASFRTAVQDSGVGHVVLLSSIAAHLPTGTGPIVSLHHIEKALSGLKAHVTFLRAGYFMENLLANLHPMKEQGVLPGVFTKPAEMVATADIGAVAAELLRAGTSAPRVVELSGPAPRTLADAAKVFGGALKKELAVPTVPLAAQFDVLKGVGLPPTWAQAYADMNAAVEHGTLVFEGTPRRGLVSLERFVGLALQG